MSEERGVEKDVSELHERVVHFEVKMEEKQSARTASPNISNVHLVLRYLWLFSKVAEKCSKLLWLR